MMIAYAIRNKKDGRFVFGFDYRSNGNKPKMIYINEEDQEYNTPKLFSEFEVKGKYNELLLKKIPKCCEIVKVEIKEVKDDGTQKSADDQITESL